MSLAVWRNSSSGLIAIVTEVILRPARLVMGCAPVSVCNQQPPMPAQHFRLYGFSKRGLCKRVTVGRQVVGEVVWSSYRSQCRICSMLIHGLAPSYLADDWILVSTVAGRRRLRSADTMELSVRRTRTVIATRALQYLVDSFRRQSGTVYQQSLE